MGEAHVEAGMNKAESVPEEPVVHVMAPNENKVESDPEEPDVHVMSPSVKGTTEEREASQSEENPCVASFEQKRKRDASVCASKWQAGRSVHSGGTTEKEGIARQRS